MLIDDQLKQVFLSALELPPGTDVEHAEYSRLEGWDSTAHMVLIAEIEAAFNIMLSTEDVLNLSSFAKAKEIILAHTAAESGQPLAESTS